MIAHCTAARPKAPDQMSAWRTPPKARHDTSNPAHKIMLTSESPNMIAASEVKDIIGRLSGKLITNW